MIYSSFRLRLRSFAIVALAASALAGAAGCVHRIDIQQGNFLDHEDLERVSVGMTRVQVRALLGTPMVADPFHHGRWDYVYYLKKGRWQKPEYRHFIVYFDEADKVARIDWPAGAPAKPDASTAADRASGEDGARASGGDRGSISG